MSTEIREIKSSLAKLLATENITVQFAAVETASFDVKNRVLLIPTYKDMSSQCLDLFVGHEVGHALWTPADGILEHVKDKNFHTFMNVVEDVRIERKIQAKYLWNSVLKIESVKIKDKEAIKEKILRGPKKA